MADISATPSPQVRDGTHFDEIKNVQLSTTQPHAPTTSKSGADAALNLLQETSGLQRPVDAETSKRLLRKIDLRIMPLICIVYFLQYIDKTAISYASVTGIIQDTGLHGNQFNWVASIFFFGCVPSAFTNNKSLTLLSAVANWPLNSQPFVSSSSFRSPSTWPSTSPSGVPFSLPSQPASRILRC